MATLFLLILISVIDKEEINVTNSVDLMLR